MLELIILVTASIATILLAIVTLIKNPRAQLNRYFFLFVVSFVIWSIVNYISLHPIMFSQLTWVRLVIFWATLLSIFLPLAINVFPNGQPQYPRLKRLIVPLGLFVAILTLSPYVFTALVYSHDSPQPVVGPGIFIFGPFAIGTIFLSLHILVRKFIVVTGRFKEQVRLALIGIASTFGLILLSNFILVVFFGISNFLALAPLYSFLLVASFAYAIIRHRLFDIRLLVTRFLAYLLLLMTIGLMYGLTIASLSLLTLGVQLQWSQVLISTSVACALLFVAQPLKHFFDGITRVFFYQDAYRTKNVLDQLSSALVRESTIDTLATRSLTILSNAIKPHYAAILLVGKNRHKVERSFIVGSQNGHDLSTVLQKLPNRHMSLILQDDLENHSDSLYRVMQKNDVAVILRLQTSREIIGYIIIGYKESGNIYTTQDIDLLRIAAGEIAVAAQNVLRFEEISRFNETLQERIAIATKKLRASNQQLQQLDQAKDEFISMASHQLRTPLTSVKGYLSMILEGDAGQVKPTQRPLLEEAYASAQRMVYLIGDFLNISRLKTGKFIIEASSVHLGQIVQEEVDQLRTAAEARNIRIVCHVPSNLPLLKLDENKLRQVIMNFIDNAIFYSKEGGTITINLVKTAKEITLTVEDQGIGVPADERQHVFNKFFRATNARKARPDGTGIGLFMARKVIVAHGGSVIFKSEENKGSTFGFRLPLTAELRVDEADLKNQPKALKK